MALYICVLMFVAMYEMYSNRTYFVHIGGVFMLSQYVMPFFVYSPSKKLERNIYHGTMTDG